MATSETYYTKSRKAGRYSSRFKGAKRECRRCSFYYYEDEGKIKNAKKGWLCIYCIDKNEFEN